MPPRKFKALYFPMLKLPSLMIQRTIRKMSASDVFHFSLISPEHLECVRRTRGHALSGAEITLVVRTPELMEIEFKPVDANVGKIIISVENIERAAEYILKNEKLDQEINGFPMKIALYGNNPTVYIPSGFNSKIALINCCFENLQCQGISLHFESPSHQMSIYQPLVKTFKQCLELKIKCYTGLQSNVDTERFLSDVQISRKFHLYQHSVEPLKLPLSVFSANNVLINSTIVMTRETLLSINCEYASFSRTSITSEDLSAFVVKWFNSDGTRFKRLIVETEISFEPLDLSTIPGQYIEPMENGKTKILRADGTFAVVIFDRQFFDFRVSDEEVKFR